MNKDKAITLITSTIVIVLALCIGLGGNFLLHKYKDQINKLDKKTTVKENLSSDSQLYMKKTQDKIKQNWNPPKENQNGKVVVKYKIGKDGNLKSFKIIQSSGSKKLDDSAEQSVKKSAPFEPLPKEIKSDDIDIQFTFNYNVKEK